MIKCTKSLTDASNSKRNRGFIPTKCESIHLWAGVSSPRCSSDTLTAQWIGNIFNWTLRLWLWCSRVLYIICWVSLFFAIHLYILAIIYLAVLYRGQQKLLIGPVHIIVYSNILFQNQNRLHNLPYSYLSVKTCKVGKIQLLYLLFRNNALLAWRQGQEVTCVPVTI